jgi:hypothetical protein
MSTTNDPEMEARVKHWETVLDGKDPIDWIADYEEFKTAMNIVFKDLQNRILALEHPRYTITPPTMGVDVPPPWTPQTIQFPSVNDHVTITSTSPPTSSPTSGPY